MQATVFCKTVAKDVQAYFVRVDGQDYFLFNQRFYRSNNEFFRNGADVNKIGSYASAHSTSVRKTLDKLPAYLRYAEREYGVKIYTKKQKKQSDRQSGYNRNTFKRQDHTWEAA